MTGFELKRLRQKKHLTREQLAKKIGVSVRTVEAWEQGCRKLRKPIITLLKYHLTHTTTL